MMDIQSPLPLSSNLHKINRSVTFDLPAITTEPEEIDTEGWPRSNEQDSPCIDINAHIVPDTILVALLDRGLEMKRIVNHKLSFFLSLQQCLGPVQWSAFERILYSARSQLPDKEWMTGIESILNRIPGMVATFKELVGYIDRDEIFDDDDNVCIDGVEDLEFM